MCPRAEKRRFAGNDAAGEPHADGPRVLDVVTLNIKFGRRIDEAKQLFARVGELARAHVVLLQEMDASPTQRPATTPMHPSTTIVLR